MSTVVEIDGYVGLKAELQRVLGVSFKVQVAPYGFDHRNGWDTYIVKLNGHGAVGFTDGPIEIPENERI